jgi:hypothetical protein
MVDESGTTVDNADFLWERCGVRRAVRLGLGKRGLINGGAPLMPVIDEAGRYLTKVRQ